MLARYGLRTVALSYLALVLVVPCAMIVQRTFQDGLGPVWDALTDPAFVHALKLTLVAVAIAVPANTIFGVMCAMALVRRRPRGAPFFTVAIGLPLALSPVVVGLSLILVYGKQGWVGGWFETMPTTTFWLMHAGFAGAAGVVFVLFKVILAPHLMRAEPAQS